MNNTHYNQLLHILTSFAGVQGLGFGLKERSNCLTSVQSWRVYVEKKLPRSIIEPSQVIPTSFRGCPIDVIEISRTICTSGIDDQLLLSGRSIANSSGIPGSLGCVAWSKKEKELVFVTNYHVLFSGGAKRNDPVWLIGSDENRTTAVELGKAIEGRFCPVNYDSTSQFIDCAIGTIEGLAKARSNDISLREPKSFRQAKVGMKVHKMGAASGLTKGIIVDTCYPDTVCMDKNVVNAPNQILIRPVNDKPEKRAFFSRKGDSGSVLSDANNVIVGLLWGSNMKGEGIACHIGPVVKELNLEAT